MNASQRLDLFGWGQLFWVCDFLEHPQAENQGFSVGDFVDQVSDFTAKSCFGERFVSVRDVKPTSALGRPMKMFTFGRSYDRLSRRKTWSTR
jgi:hypothetical protein